MEYSWRFYLVHGPIFLFALHGHALSTLMLHLITAQKPQTGDDGWKPMKS